MLKALHALHLAVLDASPAGAAAPSTLGYQGRRTADFERRGALVEHGVSEALPRARL